VRRELPHVSWHDAYHYGRLPRGVNKPEDLPESEWTDPEIRDICTRIDRRKVAIALYVRARYPRHLLEWPE
jgi:hypothetical protein